MGWSSMNVVTPLACHDPWYRCHMRSAVATSMVASIGGVVASSADGSVGRYTGRAYFRRDRRARDALPADWAIQDFPLALPRVARSGLSHAASDLLVLQGLETLAPRAAFSPAIAFRTTLARRFPRRCLRSHALRDVVIRCGLADLPGRLRLVARTVVDEAHRTSRWAIR
jgi:hypothetical protein